MFIYEKKVPKLEISICGNDGWPSHVHRHLEVIICRNGCLACACNGVQKLLQPGDLMIVFPNEIHSLYRTDAGEGISIIIDPTYLPLLENASEHRRYENFLTGNDFDFIALGEQLVQEFYGDAQTETLTGYLYLIIGQILKRLPSYEQEIPIKKETFDLVLEYIYSHYTEDLSLKNISKKFGLDACHLSRLFRQKLSWGYLQFVHSLRIEHAKHLLQTTNHSISYILSLCGFSDQKTFNRVFKEITGFTPSQYRTMRRTAASKKKTASI